MNDQEILTKVQECVSGALGIEPEEVKPEASLVRDLGAESIDFIDIIFRLEKTFDLKIPSGELFPANLLKEEGLVREGVLTSEGLKVLREKMPYFDLTEFEKDPKVSTLAGHFKVQMVLNYVRDRVSKNIQAT